MYPALAAVANLKSIFMARFGQGYRGLTLQWVGTRGGMEADLVSQAGIPLEVVRASGIVGKGLVAGVCGAFNLIWGSLEALWIVRRFQPDMVLVTGGYSAIPIAVAAWIWGVPIAVYLPDIEPGLAVRSVARLARIILVTSEESRRFFPNDKIRVIGYPVRPEIIEASKGHTTMARQHFGLAVQRPTLLVVGGSRGARSINTALLDAVSELVGQAGIQIVHVTGTLDWQVMRSRRAALAADIREYYHVYRYLSDDMGLALRAADLVVSRAGASSLGEYPVFGLPAILVPYPHAWHYQRVNADALASHGAAVRMNDEDLGTDLAITIRDLLSDEDRLSRMQSQMRLLAMPEAGERLAVELVSLA